MNEGRIMGLYFIVAIAVIALIGITVVFAKKEDVQNEALMSRVKDLESAVARLDRSSAKQSDLAEMEDMIAEIQSKVNKSIEVIELYRTVVKEQKPIEIAQTKPFLVELMPKKPAKQVKNKK